MAGQEKRVVSPEPRIPTDQCPSAEVLIEPHVTPAETVAGKDVRELQATIARAFSLLEEAADREGDAAKPAAPAEPAAATRRLGSAPASEVRHRLSFANRVLKTLAGLAIVAVIGVVPFQRITALVSGEAYIQAPIYLIRSPADGVVRLGHLAVGNLVARDVPLALIENPTGSARDVAVVSAGDGKVWNVYFQPGDHVAEGDLIARVLGCSATSVVATVSEGVYDRLRPGMPARFNFYGSDRFIYGKVANLLGKTGHLGDFAIAPLGLSGGAYRVAVALPGLGAVEDCAVGRRGIVVFDPPAR